jgi:hypothetical protein
MLVRCNYIAYYLFIYAEAEFKKEVTKEVTGW